MEQDVIMTRHQEVEQMLKTYRNTKKELALMLAKLRELEKRIKSYILETGELVEVEGGSTSIRKSYVRSSWDNNGLRGYAVAYPEVLKFVKETEIKSSVSIKVK